MKDFQGNVVDFKRAEAHGYDDAPRKPIAGAYETFFGEILLYLVLAGAFLPVWRVKLGGPETGME